MTLPERVRALSEAARDYLLHDGSGIGLDADNPWRGDYDAAALIEARRRLRLALDAAQILSQEPSLDAAWKAAEAALPKDAIIRGGRTGGGMRRGWATAYLHGEHLATEFGDTFAAALQALASRLSRGSQEP